MLVETWLLTMNSEECSELQLDATSAAMILFNNGYVVTTMHTSSMMHMDNALQVTIQPSTTNHSIYYYFSSTFEVSTVC